MGGNPLRTRSIGYPASGVRARGGRTDPENAISPLRRAAQLDSMWGSRRGLCACRHVERSSLQPAIPGHPHHADVPVL